MALLHEYRQIRALWQFLLNSAIDNSLIYKAFRIFVKQSRQNNDAALSFLLMNWLSEFGYGWLLGIFFENSLK